MVCSELFKLSLYSRKCLFLFRVPEAVYVIITAGVAYALASSNLIISTNKMEIPSIQIDSAGNKVQNPANSYPIFLKAATCYGPDISACIKLKEQGKTLTAGCCQELYNSSVFPRQAVSNSFLYFLAIIIPFIILFIRVGIWRYYIAKQWPTRSTRCTSFKTLLLQIFSLAPDKFNILFRLNLPYERTAVNNDVRHDQSTTNTGNLRSNFSASASYTEDRRQIALNRPRGISEVEQNEMTDSVENIIKNGREVDIAAHTGIPAFGGTLNESFRGRKIMRSTLPASHSSPLQHMFWLLLLYEPTAGLGVTLVFEAIIILALKRFVGAARPNYYALSAWASVYSDRSTNGSSAYMSFPSGHAATAAAGLGFVALVLMTDVQKLKAKHWRDMQCCIDGSDDADVTTCINTSSTNIGANEDTKAVGVIRTCDTVALIVIYSLIVMLCVCLALWIGASRITDYYHSATDVIGTSLPIYSACLIPF
jgi:PAP2 superfamily